MFDCFFETIKSEKKIFDGQYFSRFLGKKNLYKADIPLKRTVFFFFFEPMVSALEGFHCIIIGTQLTINNSEFEKTASLLRLFETI